MKLLTPKLDLVFKLLFTNDLEILRDLVNAVLDFPEHQHIQSIQVKNPTILPGELAEKLIILDLQAIDDHERSYDIEMQVRKYAFYPERSLYYLCRLYASQLDAGESYASLKPVIGIHFLDYTVFPEHSDLHWCFEFRDWRHPELCLSKDMALHFFELPKVEQSGEANEKIREWLHFFNHAHEEEDDDMVKTHYQTPAIQKAFGILKRLSADEETRQLAELREKALKTELAEIAAARKEGEQIGIDIGMNLGMNLGMSKGKLIGKIQVLLDLLRRPAAADSELEAHSTDELERMLRDLETAFDVPDAAKNSPRPAS